VKRPFEQQACTAGKTLGMVDGTILKVAFDIATPTSPLAHYCREVALQALSSAHMPCGGSAVGSDTDVRYPFDACGT
jgi:hypothetical protein